jgi:hypothetical protein
MAAARPPPELSGRDRPRAAVDSADQDAPKVERTVIVEHHGSHRPVSIILRRVLSVACGLTLLDQYQGAIDGGSRVWSHESERKISLSPISTL